MSDAGAALTWPGTQDPIDLLAWCVVPYDTRERDPAQRAAMLADLGIGGLAWDWRDRHLPLFEAELEALAAAGRNLAAVWLPTPLDGPPWQPAGSASLDTLRRRGVTTDLWVCTMYGDWREDPRLPAAEHAAMVRRHVDVLRPVADAAGEAGCRIALYNHLGWFGEPEHQLDVVQALAGSGLDNVGLVYNQHHGHAHVERFGELLALMAPHLYALNLNGTDPDGETTGRKILPVGAGEADQELLDAVLHSGWRGPIGLIGHSEDDAELRLRDNLAGLRELLRRARGRASTGPGDDCDAAPRWHVPVPHYAGG